MVASVAIGDGEDAMRGPLKRRVGRQGEVKPTPASAVSDWSDAKVGAILAAFESFLSNQAMKHQVEAAEVRALIRDELLDPGGG
jgi:hypothetical protein